MPCTLQRNDQLKSTWKCLFIPSNFRYLLRKTTRYLLDCCNGTLVETIAPYRASQLRRFPVYFQGYPSSTWNLNLFHRIRGAREQLCWRLHVIVTAFDECFCLSECEWRGLWCGQAFILGYLRFIRRFNFFLRSEVLLKQPSCRLLWAKE